MSVFNLKESFLKAGKRFEAVAATPQRSDRGQLRLNPLVRAALIKLLHSQERRPMREVREELAAFCAERDLTPPSRSTLYKSLTLLPTPSIAMMDLPAGVAEVLHNLSPESRVPTKQLAFACFNHGSSKAVSYAAGLPWLGLFQAAHLPGWRRRSRGLLQAVLRVRGIA